MTSRLINKIILIAGAWKESNGQDVGMEKEFEILLAELQEVESISREEAVRRILKEVS